MRTHKKISRSQYCALVLTIFSQTCFSDVKASYFEEFLNTFEAEATGQDPYAYFGGSGDHQEGADVAVTIGVNAHITLINEGDLVSESSITDRTIYDVEAQDAYYATAEIILIAANFNTTTASQFLSLGGVANDGEGGNVTLSIAKEADINISNSVTGTITSTGSIQEILVPIATVDDVYDGAATSIAVAIGFDTTYAGQFLSAGGVNIDGQGGNSTLTIGERSDISITNESGIEADGSVLNVAVPIAYVIDGDEVIASSIAVTVGFDATSASQLSCFGAFSVDGEGGNAILNIDRAAVVSIVNNSSIKAEGSVIGADIPISIGGDPYDDVAVYAIAAAAGFDLTAASQVAASAGCGIAGFGGNAALNVGENTDFTIYNSEDGRLDALGSAIGVSVPIAIADNVFNDIVGSIAATIDLDNAITAQLLCSGGAGIAGVGGKASITIEDEVDVSISNDGILFARASIVGAAIPVTFVQNGYDDLIFSAGATIGFDTALAAQLGCFGGAGIVGSGGDATFTFGEEASLKLFNNGSIKAEGFNLNLAIPITLFGEEGYGEVDDSLVVSLGINAGFSTTSASQLECSSGMGIIDSAGGEANLLIGNDSQLMIYNGNEVIAGGALITVDIPVVIFTEAQSNEIIDFGGALGVNGVRSSQLNCSSADGLVAEGGSALFSMGKDSKISICNDGLVQSTGLVVEGAIPVALSSYSLDNDLILIGGAASFNSSAASQLNCLSGNSILGTSGDAVFSVDKESVITLLNSSEAEIISRGVVIDAAIPIDLQLGDVDESLSSIGVTIGFDVSCASQMLCQAGNGLVGEGGSAAFTIDQKASILISNQGEISATGFTLSITAPIDYYSDSIGDILVASGFSQTMAGQLFCHGGIGLLGPGGNATVSIDDDASLKVVNSGGIFTTGRVIEAIVPIDLYSNSYDSTDALISFNVATGAQLCCLGNAGIGAEGGGASFSIGENAEMTFINSAEIGVLGEICNILVPDYENGYYEDDMQIAFEETNAAQVLCSGGVGGFDLGGSATFTTENHAKITICNSSEGSISAIGLVENTGEFAYHFDALVNNSNFTNPLSDFNVVTAAQLSCLGGVDIGGAGGDAVITIGDSSTVTIINKGDISTGNADTAYACQVLFDGSRGGAATLNTGNDVVIRAVNEGSIGANFCGLSAQMYFNDATINGGPTLIAMSDPSICAPPISPIFMVCNGVFSPLGLQGIIFDGSSTAIGANIGIYNTSLILNTDDPSFQMGSLFGDDLSLVELNQDLEIHTEAGSNFNFAGVIEEVYPYGNSVSIYGFGTQGLSGDNEYTGLTSVNEESTLILNGFIPGNVLVQNQGTIGGLGHIGGNLLVTNKGTVAPGLGTFQIDGNYQQTSETTYLAEISGQYLASGTPLSSLLNINGRAALSGTLILSSVDGTYSIGRTYVVVQAEDGIINEFDQIIVQNPFLTHTTYYNPDPTLEITMATNLVIGAKTKSQAKIALQVDGIALPVGGEEVMIDALLNETFETLPNALDQMDGEQYAYLVGINQYADRRFTKRIFDALRQELTPCGQTLKCGDLDGWMSVELGRAFISSSQEGSGMHQSSVGVSVGAHTPVSESILIGVAGNFESDHVSFNLGGHTTMYNGQGSLYASYNNSCWYLFSDLVVGGSRAHVKRAIDINVLEETAHSTVKYMHGSWYAEGGFDYSISQFLIQPFVGVDVSLVDSVKFRESKADAFNLDVHQYSTTTPSSYLGVHLSFSENSIFFEADLAWQHRFGYLGTKLHNRFVDFGNFFDINVSSFQRDSFIGSLYAEVLLWENFNVYGEFSGECGNHWSAYAGSIGLSANW